MPIFFSSFSPSRAVLKGTFCWCKVAMKWVQDGQPPLPTSIRHIDACKKPTFLKDIRKNEKRTHNHTHARRQSLRRRRKRSPKTQTKNLRTKNLRTKTWEQKNLHSCDWRPAKKGKQNEFLGTKTGRSVVDRFACAVDPMHMLRLMNIFCLALQPEMGGAFLDKATLGLFDELIFHKFDFVAFGNLQTMIRKSIFIATSPPPFTPSLTCALVDVQKMRSKCFSDWFWMPISTLGMTHTHTDNVCQTYRKTGRPTDWIDWECNIGSFLVINYDNWVGIDVIGEWRKKGHQ